MGDLKQSLVEPSGLLPQHQKLILTDGTELNHDEQTLEEAGLEADSGVIGIQVVATAHKLRRLDSVAKYATALDKRFALATQVKIDFIRNIDMTALCRDAVRDHPNMFRDQTAQTAVVADFKKKLDVERDAFLTERLQKESKELFDEYDKNGNGSLAQDEVETLLADLIVLNQKNLPLMSHITLDESIGIAQGLIRALFETVVRQQQPELEGSALEEVVNDLVSKHGPKDSDIRSKAAQSTEKQSKLLQDVAADTDTFSRALAEEMDKNHDGRVECAEFVAHYSEAMTKVWHMVGGDAA